MYEPKWTNRSLPESQMSQRADRVLSRVSKANLHRANDRFDRARALYLKALDSSSEIADINVKVTCYTELSLCYLLECQFDLCMQTEEAVLIELFGQGGLDERKLDSACMLSGESRARLEAVERSLTRLLSVCFQQQKYEDAEIRGEQLLLCLEKLYGQRSPRLAPAAGILGTVKFVLGKFGEAQAIYNHGLEILTEAGWDPSNEQIIGFFKGLGVSLCNRGGRKHGRLYCQLASFACSRDQSLADKLGTFGEILDLAMSCCEQDDYFTGNSICRTAMHEYNLRGASDSPSRLFAIANMLDRLGQGQDCPEIRARAERILLGDDL